MRYEIARFVPIAVYLNPHNCTAPQFSTTILEDPENTIHSQVLSTVLQFLIAIVLKLVENQPQVSGLKRLNLSIVKLFHENEALNVEVPAVQDIFKIDTFITKFQIVTPQRQVIFNETDAFNGHELIIDPGAITIFHPVGNAATAHIIVLYALFGLFI